jgi:hypothetical protein
LAALESLAIMEEFSVIQIEEEEQVRAVFLRLYLCLPLSLSVLFYPHDLNRAFT